MNRYKCPYDIVYHSDRYNEDINVPKGYESDGATFASDIWSEGWWIHDKLCDTGTFDSGNICTPWQASCVLSDVLKSEHRHIRAFTWKWATYLFGPKKLGKARLAAKEFVKNHLIAESPEDWD